MLRDMLDVLHTGLAFSRVDAFAALEACAKEIARNALAERPERACMQL